MPHNPTCNEDFVNPGSDFEALTQLLPAQQRKSYRSGLRQIIIEPAGGLGRKSTVYGLNGLRPTPARRCPHLHPRPSGHGRTLLLLRPLSVGRCFAFGQKIWHNILFSSKANFKIFPKLLPKPRRASRSLKNSPAMLLPRYLGWNTLLCLLAKSPSLSP